MQFQDNGHVVYTDTLVDLMRSLHVSVCVLVEEPRNNKAMIRYYKTFELLYKAATGLDADAAVMGAIFSRFPTKQEMKDARGA